MALLDILKKRKKKPSKALAAEAEKKKEVAKAPGVIKEEKAERIPEVEKPRVKKERKIVQSYKILKAPHITEKATDLTKKNQYVFRIWPEANKIEIKKTIEDLYDVDVISVKVINVPPKKRRLGRTPGWREGYKKAIVKIKEGQKIEVMPR